MIKVLTVIFVVLFFALGIHEEIYYQIKLRIIYRYQVWLCKHAIKKLKKAKKNYENSNPR